MTKLLLFLSLLCLFSSAEVLEVSTAQFEELIAFSGTADAVLLMIFDPSCSFCQKVKPEFLKAGELITSKLPNITVGTVDLQKEYLVAHKTRITHVPSLRLFRRDSVPAYEDIRYYTSSEIVNVMFRIFHLHSYELSTKAEVAEFIQSYDAVGIYYGGRDDVEFGVFKQYLELHENVQLSFGHIFDEGIITEMQLSPERRFAILRQADNSEDFIYFNGVFTLPAFTNFIHKESFPTVSAFDQRIMNEIFKTGNSLLIVIKKPNQKRNEKIEANFRAACEEIREKMRCSATFSDDEYAKALMEKLGITDADLPQMRIIQGKTENSLQKFRPSQKGFEKEHIAGFAGDFLNGKAEQYWKSEAVPPGTSSPIKNLVRSTYENLVKDPNFDVLVEFYAPWCNHCQKIENLMKSLSNNLKKVPSLVFARIDHSKNDIDGVEIDELPYILFYTRDDKQHPVRYREEFDYSSFVAFLKDHTTVETHGTVLDKSSSHQEL